MRPSRLELEGFTAYREYTVVDFEGADLFVLTGPTGAGKSSLIDAMTFALYGSVSRYANPNIVHPVVSQGKTEAKVRFDFSAGGRCYTAVRVVRRNPKGGATTREARLESDGKLLAGSAEDVSRQVREVLGLNFEQFTTCVVLPQGEFARFLHDKPGERQDLLTKLLGLGIYDRMGNLARIREAEAKQRTRFHQEELEGLAGATGAAKKRAARRVKELKELERAIRKVEPELERLSKTAGDQRAEAERLKIEARKLQEIRAPEGLSDLTGKLDAVCEALEVASKRSADAEEALDQVERTRAKLGDPIMLEEARRAQREHQKTRAELESARREAAHAERKRAVSESKRARTAEKRRAARAAVEEARRELAAHDLASHLKKGKPCPVCRQKVNRLPEPALPFELEDAERQRDATEEEHRAAEESFREAEKLAALASDKVTGLEKKLAELERKLDGAPAPETVASELEAIGRLEGKLETARASARKAREAERRAREAVERLQQEERCAWKRFEEARDALASLAPPGTDRESLKDAWQTLIDWAHQRAPEISKRAEQARRAAKEAEKKRRSELDGLGARCSELGVVIEHDRPGDSVVGAVAQAEHELQRVSEAVDRAGALRKQIEEERERALVAGALGRHLRADGFERWLLDEAFRRLVEGATHFLRELSSGQYSFEYDDRLNFEVVDHRNADEQRSARTLSGGETFLASLALALTLAEQTADLAARGSARLESLFLDEGFGTLDDDTLEIVAAAIEELGARGRIVGLVTHQPSLAEKIPVQYRVTRTPATATVERISA